ncbi:hypothetical protein MNB_SV-12-978 [hydrothermal vent metagenome]|uniref:Spore coat protein U domain-containing protein n=1 Tax=hydrothermal vent metagenome TaxID=652676 RepID=A0A1W1BLM5_9ZZZZ
MKKICILLIVIFSNIWADYLTVSSQPITEDGSGTVLLNNFSIDFSTLTLPSSNVVRTIDVYLKSDSTANAVNMTISGDSQLKNGNEKMDISLSYNGNTITLGTPFELLGAGEGARDGSKIGTIEVKINSVTPVQLLGEYNIDLNMDLEGQSTQTLPIKATVPTITVAGFSSTQTETGVNRFLGTTLDFGNFEFDKKNTIDNDLYIRSNSSQSLYISFDTDDMVHESDTDYKIAMQYYWNGTAYSKNTKIKTLTGVDKGEISIGTMTFETQTIDSSLIAGDYSATINVTITVE